MSLDPEKIKECMGCRGWTLDKIGYCQVVPVLKDGSECPCLHCLVKVMCNSACMDFLNYINKEVREDNKKCQIKCLKGVTDVIIMKSVMDS